VSADSGAGHGSAGKEQTAPVVIAGGGPAGLMLAIELCLGGVTPIVLERLPEISDIPKGNGLVGQIVAVLDYRGLLDRLRAESTYTGPVPGFSFGPLRLDFSGLGASPLQVLAIPQRRLEHALAERLAERGGSILRGHALTEFSQHDDAVAVSVTGPAGDYQLTASYLVGCDGAHSQVRKQAGIGFPGYTSREVSRIGRVRLPTAVLLPGTNDVELSGLGRVQLTQQQRTPRGMFSIASLLSLDATAADGSYIVWTREDASGPGGEGAPRGAGEPRRADGQRSDSDSEPPVTLAELQASFRRVTGADLPMSDPTWLTQVTGNSRQAERYQAGRVLLAGDAAHVFGAGGSLNVGLLDAVNLGWKLAAEVRGWTPPGLLASYQTERHAAGSRALLHTRAQRALSERGESAEALRDLVGELLTMPGVARHFGELVAGSDVRYEMTDRAADRHPLAGRLAPDLRLATTDGTTRIAELMRAAEPLLLDFTPDGRVVPEAAGWQGRVPAVVVKQPDEPPVADGLLIRPDGIVAWASGPRAPDPAAGLAEALAAWCGAPSRATS
jgi:2-polyprenyl-6-methoxyphenol hydroxylase-like FAD-dependent oxidoreductase